MGLLDRLTRSSTPELVRDPSAATQSLGYVTPGRATPPEWDAANAITWGYYGNVFVYACVQAIATDLAARKIRVGADPDKPHDFDPKAPLARLLGPPPGGPNRNTSARQLIAWSVAQRKVTGQLGWELELDSRGIPIALWPLAAQHLRRIPSTSGSAYFAGFEYGPTHDAKRLAAEQVFYSWRPSAHDWREPESALRAARLDVSVAVMQDQYDFAFLKNDARPATVVVHEAFAEDGEREAFRAQWDAQHRGVENAGSVAFAEAEGSGPEGVKNTLLIEQLGLSQRDAMFVERYAGKIRGICVGLGVPLSRLMDASGRTFSNAGAEFAGYWRSTVFNEGQDLIDAINIQLAPLFGDGNVAWFDYSDIPDIQDKAVPVTTAASAPALVQAQLMTVNEARADYGLKPLPDGDRMMTPAEIQALKGGAVPAQDPTPVPDPTTMDAPEGETRDAVIEEPSAEDVAAATERRRSKIWTTANSTVRALERSWEREFRRLFERQATSAVSRLEGKRGRQAYEHRAPGDPVPDPKTVFDPGFWTATTDDIAQGLYETVFAAGGARVSDLFGIAFDLEAQHAAAFIAARSNQLAGQVTNTTYQAIQGALQEGVAAGEGIPDLAKRVREVFDVATKTRAVTIARTEVISAYNGSAVTVASQLPSDVVGGQEWIATRDARTRESHAELDGARANIGQPFDNGLAYPGDPSGDPAETVNCRCTIAFLTPDEMGERAAPATVSIRHAQTFLRLVRFGDDAERIERILVAA